MPNIRPEESIIEKLTLFCFIVKHLQGCLGQLERELFHTWLYLCYPRTVQPWRIDPCLRALCRRQPYQPCLHPKRLGASMAAGPARPGDTAVTWCLKEAGDRSGAQATCRWSRYYGVWTSDSQQPSGVRWEGQAKNCIRWMLKWRESAKSMQHVAKVSTVYLSEISYSHKNRCFCQELAVSSDATLMPGMNWISCSFWTQFGDAFQWLGNTPARMWAQHCWYTNYLCVANYGWNQGCPFPPKPMMHFPPIADCISSFQNFLIWGKNFPTFLPKNVCFIHENFWWPVFSLWLWILNPPPISGKMLHFPSISGNLLFLPYFLKFPRLIYKNLPIFACFTCFLFPPSLTMMRLCITPWMKLLFFLVTFRIT